MGDLRGGSCVSWYYDISFLAVPELFKYEVQVMKWGFETTIEGEAVFSVLFSIGMRQVRERNEVQSFRELVHERKWFLYGVSNTGRMEDNIFNIIMINAGVRNTVLGLWTVERAEKIHNIHIWLRRVIKVSWKSLSFFFYLHVRTPFWNRILRTRGAHVRCCREQTKGSHWSQLPRLDPITLGF